MTTQEHPHGCDPYHDADKGELWCRAHDGLYDDLGPMCTEVRQAQIDRLRKFYKPRLLPDEQALLNRARETGDNADYLRYWALMDARDNERAYGDVNWQEYANANPLGYRVAPPYAHYRYD